MAYIDYQSSTIQLLMESLEKMFNAGGWDTVTKYRAFSKINGDNYRKKFAEVILFRSMGSDKQIRNFGIAHGYGSTTATPMGEEDVIASNTELGFLGTGDGTKTTFKFKVFPLLPYTATIYFDGVKVDESKYTIDGEAGTLTLQGAGITESAGKKITAIYSLSDNAPGMPARLYFFTFEDAREERTVLRSQGDPESTLESVGGGVFNIKIGSNKVKAGSMRLYDSAGNQITSDFTIDYEANTVTFTGGNIPTSVKADFIMVLNKTGTDLGDIEVASFNPADAKSLMTAVYSAISYTYPSLPTAVSFIRDNEYGAAWTRDSQIFIWGNITKDRAMLFFRPDSAPEPEAVYFTPLYIGRMSVIGKAPRHNHVIIAGCRTQDEIQHVDGIKLGRYTVDYGVNTSNGNNSVLVQQAIGGAYYQKHYLSFITHDVAMEESVESRFNPSVYSGKYHISPVYVVHPDDGYAGRLDEVYAVHPKNISQGDELEVEESARNEEVGRGDGTRREFHLFHTPVDGTLELKVDCVLQERGTDFDFDEELKLITFRDGHIPADGAEILANYDYKQVYKYTMPDSPQVPFNDPLISPYVPIGLGILKENI